MVFHSKTCFHIKVYLDKNKNYIVEDNASNTFNFFACDCDMKSYKNK